MQPITAQDIRKRMIVIDSYNTGTNFFQYFFNSHPALPHRRTCTNFKYYAFFL